MANGANGVHLQLREALEDYIKSQYFGKSPILLSAVQNKLDQEGILYQKPYIESSPAYKSELNGIQKSSKLPDWVKAYFDALANADLGVHSSPFCHQVEALEAAFAGKDLFVSTGTGSGKTECFMWPLLAKLAAEARNTPANWSMRGVRTIIMYPMNALVSDQVSRLRRLIGDSEHRFVNAFRETCGEDSRRPQFGMYTGRTPYAGKEPKRSADRSLVATYSEMLNAETNEPPFLNRARSCRQHDLNGMAPYALIGNSCISGSAGMFLQNKPITQQPSRHNRGGCCAAICPQAWKWPQRTFFHFVHQGRGCAPPGR